MSVDQQKHAFIIPLGTMGDVKRIYQKRWPLGTDGKKERVKGLRAAGVP